MKRLLFLVLVLLGFSARAGVYITWVNASSCAIHASSPAPYATLRNAAGSVQYAACPALDPGASTSETYYEIYPSGTLMIRSVWLNAGGTPQNYDVAIPAMTSGSHYQLTVQAPSWSSCNTESNWVCSAVSIKNVDSVAHLYRVYTNDAVCSDYVQLYPGDTLNVSQCAEGRMDLEVVLLNSDFSEVGTVGTPVSVTNTTPTVPSAELVRDAANDGTVASGAGAVYNGSTSNIVWAEQSPDIGSSAIYDAVTKGFAQEHADLQVLTKTVASNGAPASVAPDLPDGGSQNSQGEAAASEGKGKFDQIAGSWGSPGVASGTGGGNWTVSTQFGTLYLDPFHYGWVNALALICRAILTWGSYFGLVTYCSVIVFQATSDSGKWRQASTAGTSVAGTNVNSGAALAMAALITVCVSVLPATAVLYFATFTNVLGTLIPSTGDPWVNWGIYAAQQFIPITVLAANLINGLIFRFTWTGLLWLCQTVIRFLVG